MSGIKMKNKKYHSQNNSKINYQNRRKTKNHSPDTQIHYHSLFWLGTGTSMKKNGGVKQFHGPKPVLLVGYGHASVFHMLVKYQPSHITGESTVIIKSTIILNIKYFTIVFTYLYFIFEFNKKKLI